MKNAGRGPLSCCGFFPDTLETIAVSVDRHDFPAVLRAHAELAADAADMSIHGAGVDFGLYAPYFFQQVRPGQKAARILEQVAGQLEIFLRESDFFLKQIFPGCPD